MSRCLPCPDAPYILDDFPCWRPIENCLKSLVLCLVRILISGFTSTMFANFPTITSATCAESENIWTWTKQSALRLPLCPAGLTTATPCCLVYQLGTCSSSRECRTVLPGWSPGLVALHLASPFITLSTGYPFPSEIQFKILTLTYKTLSSGKSSHLADLIHLATLNRNLWFSKGVSYLLLSPRLRLNLEFSEFVHLLSGTNFPLDIHSSESLTCFQQHLKTRLFGLVYLLS